MKNYSRMMIAQEQDPATPYLFRALTRISPTAPMVFGLDGFEASAEGVVLKLVSRFSDSLQAYMYVCYILRVAADMSSIEGREDLLPYFLRLQELVHP
jgi:hypothetical protein